MNPENPIVQADAAEIEGMRFPSAREAEARSRERTEQWRRMYSSLYPSSLYDVLLHGHSHDTRMVHDEVQVTPEPSAVVKPKPKPRVRPIPHGGKLTISPEHQRLMKDVTFRGKRVGIEWTTIPPSMYDGSYDWADEDGVIDEFMDILQSHRLVKIVSSDPGCIEIPSEPLGNWESVIKFYRACMRVAFEHGCKQESPHSTGGGGHIHISKRNWYSRRYDLEYDSPLRLDRRITQSRESIQYYLTMHPWIVWAFQDPYDNDTSMNGARCAGDPAVDDDSARGNIEFRFFDAAETLNEQIEMVAFALRLLQHPMPNMEWNDIPDYPPRVSLRQALDGWQATVRELGLPWNLYRRYRRNICTRYGLGRDYLT